MTSNLSPLAWVVLGCLAIFIILLNVSLISTLKNRDKNSGSILHKMGEGIRDPWKNENHQLEELSQRVAKLKNEEKLSVGEDQNN